ncbi:hypothetical protein G8764_14930 [Pseudomaricurvus alcaniphilus]|uniref:uroporphyrinogen-III C-methyltransferase n=1 Tax=Pseudomaricurvus alcaniphilus TaxID=1166482 RepID=UPI00140E87C4|nr:uroporphyrinogen-III C-methyltransferase [Pseudomaricurvus alcaniphilus]NHN38601.1 hypothetical protein [Pseudomaricurvus alcaniphilus]
MTTDTKAADANKAGAQPASTPAATNASAAAAKPGAGGKSAAKASEPPRKGGKLAALLFILVVLLLIGGGVLGFYGWQWQQQQLAVQNELRQELKQLSALQSLKGQVERLAARETVDPRQWHEGLDTLAALQAQVARQGNRIQNMSTTSRSDWQLAEAEYLLRLAGQRLLMERSGSGALALLQSADNILLQLDDLELFEVRGQLARDMTALKLAPQVDRSGLYLRLSALAEQVTALPVARQPLPPEKPSPIAAVEPITASASTGLWQKLRHNFNAAMQKLGDQVKVRHHDQPLPPLLPPDAEQYLRQNVRLNLEQAQLALLRQETVVYSASLERAENLLRQFFPLQPEANSIAAELARLAGENIEAKLPDISGSLQALRAFTDRLHKLEPDAGEPQIEAAVSGEAGPL